MQQSLLHVTRDRDDLQCREGSLRGKVEHLTSEVEALKKELDEAVEARANSATSEIRNQLAVLQGALKEAHTQMEAKESALQACNEQIQVAQQRTRESKELAKALEKEKGRLHEKMNEVERSVREELTRASLRAKERNKAWLEQEKHKIEREKQQMEKTLEAMRHQIEVKTASLEKTKGLHADASAKERELSKQLDAMKKALATSEKEHISTSKHMENAQKKLASDLKSLQEESQQLKETNATLKAQLQNKEAEGNLQQRIDQLQIELKEKTAQSSTLQEELMRFQSFERETTLLRAKLDEKEKALADMSKRIKETSTKLEKSDEALQMKDSCAKDLLHGLGVTDGEEDFLGSIEKVIKEERQQTARLKTQHAEANDWISRVENSLRELGLLASNKTLMCSWEEVQCRLRFIVSQLANNVGTNASAKKDTAGTRKRKAAHFETPKMLTGEGSTREVIYESCRIRENVSASPVKTQVRPRRVLQHKKAKQAEPAIKPFFQLQGTSPEKGPPATPAGLKDLDTLLFSTPAQLQTDHGHQTHATQKRSSDNMLLDEVEDQHSQGEGGGKKSGAASQAMKEAHADIVDEHVPETQVLPEAPSQQQTQMIPPKGILKEVPQSLASQAPRAIRTPCDKIAGNPAAIDLAINGAFRRPSRVASKYFDPIAGTRKTRSRQNSGNENGENMPVRVLRKTRGRYSRKK
ncbi:hypothetical protein KEM55_003787, partial [Ascosphaera atra]